MKVVPNIKFEKVPTPAVLNASWYENIKIPKRSTKNSVGYDVSIVEDVTLQPGEYKMLPTGLRVRMGSDYWMGIYNRSSNIKRGIQTYLAVSVIDSDYYDNEDNGGHFKIPIMNISDKPITLKAGDKVVQCVFHKAIVGDDICETERIGGIGSTGN